MKTKLNSFLLVLLALIAGAFFVFSHAPKAYAACNLTFTTTQNGPTPSGQSCTLSNTTPSGGEQLTWTSAGGQSWLSYTPSSGSGLNGGRSVTVNVSVSAPSMAPGTYTATISPSGNGSTNGDPNIYVTYQINSPLACSLNLTYSGQPASVPYNTSTTLTATSTNCTSVTLSGGQFSNVSLNPGSDTRTTNALTSTVTYTLNGTGAAGAATPFSLAVPVGSACTINVSSTYNGVNGAPSGQSNFSYQISGPSTITGNGPGSYPETPNTLTNWQPAYTGTYSPAPTWNQSSASCSTAGGSISFVLNFTSPPPGSPTNVTASNTNMNSSVACGAVLLNWTAGSGATSYTIYRDGAQIANNIVATTYTDNNVPAGSHSYSVQSVNAYGQSSQMAASSVSPTTCAADFSNSDIHFKYVNGISLNYSSNCIGNSTNQPSRTIKTGDIMTTSVCIVNQGNLPAQNVSVVIDTTNSNLSSPQNFTFSSGSGSVSVSGNTVTATLGSMAVNAKTIFTFTSTVTASTTQQLQRMRYTGYITYTTAQSGGPNACYGTQATAGNCTLDSGYLVFFNGVKAPNEKEVNP